MLHWLQMFFRAYHSSFFTLPFHNEFGKTAASWKDICLSDHHNSFFVNAFVLKYFIMLLT